MHAIAVNEDGFLDDEHGRRCEQCKTAKAKAKAKV